MGRKQKFWNVDRIELFKMWSSDMGTFFMTALIFLAIATPVVISGLIMSYLASLNSTVRPSREAFP